METTFFRTSARISKDHKIAKLRREASLGHSRILKTLRVELGLTAEDARASNNAALREAAGNGSVAVLRELREGFGLGAEDARAMNNHALQMAVGLGHVAVLKELREGFGLSTADARIFDNIMLQCAAERGHAAVLKELRIGFGLTAADARAQGNYALQRAAEKGHEAVVKELCEGYGLEAGDVLSSGALKIAIEFGNAKVLHYLRKKFKFTAHDALACGAAALLEACRFSNEDTLSELCNGFGLASLIERLLANEEKSKSSECAICAVSHVLHQHW